MITENTNIMKLLEEKPEALEVLMTAGLGCVGCAFAQFETLGQGLKGHGFSDDEIKEVLEEINKIN